MFAALHTHHILSFYLDLVSTFNVNSASALSYQTMLSEIFCFLCVCLLCRALILPVISLENYPLWFFSNGSSSTLLLVFFWFFLVVLFFTHERNGGTLKNHMCITPNAQLSLYYIDECWSLWFTLKLVVGKSYLHPSASSPLDCLLLLTPFPFSLLAVACPHIPQPGTGDFSNSWPNSHFDTMKIPNGSQFCQVEYLGISVPVPLLAILEKQIGS